MSEDFTLKEMLTKVIEQNEASRVQQARILERAKAVDTHLGVLNSKVATNIDRIYNVEQKQLQTSSFVKGSVFVTSGIWAIFLAVYNIIK